MSLENVVLFARGVLGLALAYLSIPLSWIALQWSSNLGLKRDLP